MELVVDTACYCCDSPMSTPLKGLQILIVDDDPDTLVLFDMALAQAGATVLMADSVGIALQMLDQHPPNVVISDIQMPHASGHTLIQIIRSRATDGQPQLPAIAVTAHARDSDRLEAIAAGFDRFLTKPVDPDMLVNAVVELLCSHGLMTGDAGQR